ncbi:hypothetical protein OIO90_002976 [Microbotryomycetes sp. JL221]|nr:hypothetical protein OIO90_002976 [Microbotryomycetes sp. JL221]
MVRLSLSLVALSSAALVAAQSGHGLIGTSLTNAFYQKLARRQDLGGTLEGLQTLLRDAITASSGSGNCSSECGNWTQTIQSCVTSNSNDNTAIGMCACERGTVSAMQSCGACLGDSQGSTAADVAQLCSQALDAMPSGANSGGLSSTASSSAASGASSAASGSSRASSGSAPAATSSGASQSGGAAPSSATGGAASPSASAPPSAAGHNGVAIGAVLAVAGFVGAVAL